MSKQAGYTLGTSYESLGLVKSINYIAETASYVVSFLWLVQEDAVTFSIIK